MQLGFVTAILPELSMEEILRFAAETGYDCVEAMCWPSSRAERRYAGITHIDCTSFGKSDAERIHKLCEQTGVSISSLGYYPNPLTPNAEESEAAIAHVRKVIAASAILGPSSLALCRF